MCIVLVHVDVHVDVHVHVRGTCFVACLALRRCVGSAAISLETKSRPAYVRESAGKRASQPVGE